MREPEPLATRLHGRVVAGAFRAHPWFANAHVQTILPTFRSMPEQPLRIERRELPDGDFVDLGWCLPPDEDRGHGPLPHGPLPHGPLPQGPLPQEPLAQGPLPQEKKPLAILLHGLSGGFDSKYARGLAKRLIALGWRAVILQFRGAGPEPNRLPRSYHHGDTEDVRELVQLLREREPDTELFAVGWSLGGNVLLKYLGEEGDATPLRAAVAVCAPFQLRPCAEKLRTGFSRVYQRHLLGELKRMIQRKAGVLPATIDLAQVARSRDFFEFDDRATALINGFRDAEDYYARAACGQYLGGIARPTLEIHAKDDPFMTPDIIPDATRLAPLMTLEVCERGGHVGFVAAGPRMEPVWWLEDRIPEFLEQQRRHD
jgi:predicted alpha/beta-fold hydrolase